MGHCWTAGASKQREPLDISQKTLKILSATHICTLYDFKPSTIIKGKPSYVNHKAAEV